MRHMFRRLFDGPMRRYIAVGTLNMAFCTAVMYLLYNLTGLDSWVCALVNHAMGGIVSYFVNKHYVFRDRRMGLRTPCLFVLNLAICYMVAYSIAIPGIELLLSQWSNTQQDNLAMGIGVLLFVVLNYFGQRYVVFRGFDGKNT
ncbi:MAG: GtrA family protein [Oscillospiraceae bacterium]|nr:GtrA family protein [Oscillospiraceae bacterium]